MHMVLGQLSVDPNPTISRIQSFSNQCNRNKLCMADIKQYPTRLAEHPFIPTSLSSRDQQHHMHYLLPRFSCAFLARVTSDAVMFGTINELNWQIQYFHEATIQSRATPSPDPGQPGFLILNHQSDTFLSFRIYRWLIKDTAYPIGSMRTVL